LIKILTFLVSISYLPVILYEYKNQSTNFYKMMLAYDKGKPSERLGRKAMGLRLEGAMIARLPNSFLAGLFSSE
jgi:hypothetical protein